MGGTNESTVNLEEYEGEIVCAVCGVTVGLIQGVECVSTWEIERDQDYTISQEGGSTRNLNISGWNK